MMRRRNMMTISVRRSKEPNLRNKATNIDMMHMPQKVEMNQDHQAILLLRPITCMDYNRKAM